MGDDQDVRAAGCLMVALATTVVVAEALASVAAGIAQGAASGLTLMAGLLGADVAAMMLVIVLGRGRR